MFAYKWKVRQETRSYDAKAPSTVSISHYQDGEIGNYQRTKSGVCYENVSLFHEKHTIWSSIYVFFFNTAYISHWNVQIITPF